MRPHSAVSHSILDKAPPSISFFIALTPAHLYTASHSCEHCKCGRAIAPVETGYVLTAYVIRDDASLLYGSRAYCSKKCWVDCIVEHILPHSPYLA